MGENKKFKLKIISPTEKVFEGECEFLEFTSEQGDMGIYKDHIPLTAILMPGTMRIHNGSEIKRIKVGEGFVEILKDQVTVLTEEADREV